MRLSYGLMLLLTLAVLSGCASAPTQQAADLNFSVVDCEGMDFERSRGVVNESWQGDQLVVDAFVSLNCGSCTVDGDYEQSGDNLTLTLQEECEQPADCISLCRVRYTLSHLTKRDYAVSLRTD